MLPRVNEVTTGLVMVMAMAVMVVVVMVVMVPHKRHVRETEVIT